MAEYTKTLLFSGNENNKAALSDNMQNYERIGFVYDSARPMTDISVTAITANPYSANIPYVCVTDNTAHVFGIRYYRGTSLNEVYIDNGGNGAVSLTGTATAINFEGAISRLVAVYGYNKTGSPNISGIGSPGDGWTKYDETVLWSNSAGSTMASINTPASSFERIKFYLCPHYYANRCSMTVAEINAPTEDSGYFVFDFTTAAVGQVIQRGYLSGVFESGTSYVRLSGKYYAGTPLDSTKATLSPPAQFTKIVGVNRKS